MSHEGPCVPYPGGQFKSCVKCGRPYHEPVPDTPQSRDMDRDDAMDARLTLEAATAGGAATAAGSLSAFAASRAHKAPIRHRTVEEWDQDGIEEGADWRNYLCWKARSHRQGFLDGDPDDTREYEHAMRTLGAVCRAWQEARTKTS
jgi:hypothetical protein